MCYTLSRRGPFGSGRERGKADTMAKSTKTVFYCKECGYESPKFMGQCPACHSWNSFVEEKTKPAKVSGGARRSPAAAGKTGRPHIRTFYFTTRGRFVQTRTL